MAAKNEYDRILTEAANTTHYVKNDGKKAIVECLYTARRNIDDMHPDTRDVHDISQKEIREIENSVREKFAHAIKQDGWYEIELTKKEVKAIHDGLVEKRFNDDLKDRHRKIDNLL